MRFNLPGPTIAGKSELSGASAAGCCCGAKTVRYLNQACVGSSHVAGRRLYTAWRYGADDAGDVRTVGATLARRRQLCYDLVGIAASGHQNENRVAWRSARSAATASVCEAVAAAATAAAHALAASMPIPAAIPAAAVAGPHPRRRHRRPRRRPRRPGPPPSAAPTPPPAPPSPPPSPPPPSPPPAPPPSPPPPSPPQSAVCAVSHVHWRPRHVAQPSAAAAPSDPDRDPVQLLTGRATTRRVWTRDPGGQRRRPVRPRHALRDRVQRLCGRCGQDVHVGGLSVDGLSRTLLLRRRHRPLLLEQHRRRRHDRARQRAARLQERHAVRRHGQRRRARHKRLRGVPAVPLLSALGALAKLPARLAARVAWVRVRDRRAYGYNTADLCDPIGTLRVTVTEEECQQDATARASRW